MAADSRYFLTDDEKARIVAIAAAHGARSWPEPYGSGITRIWVVPEGWQDGGYVELANGRFTIVAHPANSRISIESRCKRIEEVWSAFNSGPSGPGFLPRLR